ncbi:hypothetical protein RUND412_007856 [Rhizina undulata]
MAGIEASCTPESVLQQYALEFLRLDSRPTFIVKAGLNCIDANCNSNPKGRFDSALIFENRAFLERKTNSLLSFVVHVLLPHPRSRSECFESWKFTVTSIGFGSALVVTLSPPVEDDRSPNPLPIINPGHSPNSMGVGPANSTGSSEESEDPEYSTDDADSEGKTVMALPRDRCRDLVDVSQFGKTRSGRSSRLKHQVKKGLAMDWTKGQILHDSQHFRDLLAVDWASTPCGPLQSWSPYLQQVANVVISNPFPISLYWGPQYTIIYNEAWISMVQEKNPELLGKRFSEACPKLKYSIFPLLDRVLHNGETIIREAEPLFLDRVCKPEESYFDFALTPVVGEFGSPQGVLHQRFEVTQQVVNQRRMNTLQRVSRSLGDVRNLERDGFFRKLTDAFEENPLDSPFLLLYGYSGESENYILEANVGVPKDGNLAPYSVSLDHPESGYFTAEMATAKQSNSVILKTLGVPASAIHFRGYGEASSHAVVIPIQVTSSMTQVFLILGLNPRRPFDDDYKLWMELLKKEIATAVVRVQLLKDEITKAKSHQLEKFVRQKALGLQEQLHKRTEELRTCELQFTKTAETIPVGLVLMNRDGKIEFANKAYMNLATLSEDRSPDDWRYTIYKEDVERVRKAMDNAIATCSNLHLECRCGNDYGVQGWRYWLSCSIIVKWDDVTGEALGFIITVVDITSMKLNEEYQRKLSTDAMERRRQQENFIDIFSHELRNPFSATLQCADGILSALMAYQVNDGLDVEDLIDSASTILVCVQHQMRIIDDVLTLSKLDSMLLSVVPVNIQIHDSVNQILKIFHSELQAKSIKSQYVIEESYKNLNIDWIRADPSRFSQILVNLLTNAIKFTSFQKLKREITVKLGASIERPSAHGEVIYSQDVPNLDPQDVASQDWGDGEPLYIMVTVKDSGIGISSEWQKKLFKRFEQVPKTHVTYGGSGLGLFICRQLCRIQGGEIGVFSEEGHGSSFAFYIKARRTVVSRKQSALESEDGGEGKMERETTAAYGKLVNKCGAGKRGRGYRVLVVEDNLINQEVLRRQLTKEGCVASVAGNGEEAVGFVKKSWFGMEGGQGIDIVLMDMEMPVMDGNTATRIIREMERTGKLKRHVPIMGISANARREQVAKMTEAGMDDAISKPFRIADLLERFGVLLDNLGVKVGGDSESSSAPETTP